MKTKEKNTLILENKKIKFKDLLLKLFVHSEGEFLHDIFMRNCHVTDCPKDPEIFKKIKYKGRWVDLFCGFVMEKDVIIDSNIFAPNKKIPKRGK